jgi:thiamine transport system permease protein
MVILLHIVFTFPYVVRSVEAAIYQIDVTHEQAATMLGASPFTVFRTISLPLFRSALVSGAILAFTRSLSETGATMMVAGLSVTAPVLVVGYKNSGDISSAAAVSTILICSAVLLLVLAKFLSSSMRVPIVHVWPAAERALSRSYVAKRDAVLGVFLLSVILLPTFFIVLSQMGVVRVETAKALVENRDIFRSILLSFIIGLIVTITNLAFALPLGMMISKNVMGLGGVLDTLEDVILLIPTSALGLSLNLFWGNFHANEFLIIALAHMSFTFPLMVKPISTAISGVDENLLDAAKTLGAKPSKVFETITYPLIKPGIIAGVIMTFMRSLSETGATMAVSTNMKTIPVLLVELFNKKQLTDDAILACIVLFALSFVLILLLKRTSTKKNAGNKA